MRVGKVARCISPPERESLGWVGEGKARYPDSGVDALNREPSWPWRPMQRFYAFLASRTGRHVVFAPGLVVAFVGLVVLMGWWAQVSAIVQLRAGYVPMQPNTALCFVGCGLACVALAADKALPARLLACVVFALSSVTLSQYLFGVDWGVDTMLLEPHVDTLTAYSGRMSPVTAVAFMLACLSMAATSSLTDKSWRAMAAGLTASLTLGAGVSASLMYLLGSRTPFIVTQPSYMAIHTALAFDVLALGLLAVLFRSQRNAGPGWPGWLPGTAFIMSMSIVLAISETLLTEERERAHYAAPLLTYFLGPLLAGSAAVIVRQWGTSLSWASSLERTNHELHELEAQPRMLHERMSRILEAAPAAMLVCDRHGKIVVTNAKTTQIFGWDLEELMGNSIDILVPEELRAGHVGLRNQYVSSSPEVREMAKNRALEGQRKDGSRFPAEVTLSPIPSDEGMLLLAAVTDTSVRDNALEAHREAQRELQGRLNELTQANAALKHSNQALESFAYAASHDLQEPLRMICVFTELVALDYGDRLDETGKEMVQHTIDGARRMKALIDGLLEYAVIGQGDPDKVIDCEKALARVLDLYANKIDKLNAVVEVQPLPAVRAHGADIELLFRNLVANALKFSGNDAPRLEIRAVEDGQMWRFEFDDAGLGISEEQAMRVFGLFHRTQSPSNADGVGMGLALCKRVVEYHGGRIWVESSPIGGAGFRFTLPVSSSDELAQTQTAA